MSKTAVTLFSGFGLADVGLQQAGFAVVGAVEKSAAIAEWHQRNQPNCQMMIGSVSDFDYRQFAGVDLVHLSPPCQQYSRARSPNLPRHDGADAGLLAIKAIEQIRPKFITIENVPNYLRSKSYSQIKRALWELKYSFNEKILNCANYGIGQSRIRAFVRAIRTDILPNVPIDYEYRTIFNEQYWDGLYLQEQPQTKGWYSEIKDLLPDLPETTLANWQIKRLPRDIHSHLLLGDQKGMIRGDGKPAFTICAQTRLQALLIRRDGQSNGRLDIFEANVPAPTIKASGRDHQLNGWNGQKIVKITSRALARFQTIPDWFQLPERAALAAIGIGNGVPCEIMRQIAESFTYEPKKISCKDNAMTIVTGTENIKSSPIQQSQLSKKGLCDYVINVASGCLHGCTFCYVPSTPVIRCRQKHFYENGVKDPQRDWGKYLFVRTEIASQLEHVLANKHKWPETLAGKGVVMLCSGTDPYQNSQTATITRDCVEVLLKYNKRIRILTRSPLWTKDLDVLVNPLVTVGMSLPYLDDRLSRQIEPHAPLPSDRYQALKEGAAAKCRLFVAMAPTPPHMGYSEFQDHLSQLMAVNPEVIFWEPINARGTNGLRMLNAGLEFAKDIIDNQSWATHFMQQWKEVELAASSVGCQGLIHPWPDRALSKYEPNDRLEPWWSKPTVETWPSISRANKQNKDMIIPKEYLTQVSADEIIPIAQKQESEPLTRALAEKEVSILEKKIEKLKGQLKAHEERMAELKKFAATSLGREIKETLGKLQSLITQSFRYEGLMDQFCPQLQKLSENVCQTTLNKKSPSSHQKLDGENWYFEDSGKKKPLFCTNFNFFLENPQLPDVLEMRLARGKRHLERICKWAVAEGLAETYVIYDYHSPWKKLSPADTKKQKRVLFYIARSRSTSSLNYFRQKRYRETASGQAR